MLDTNMISCIISGPPPAARETLLAQRFGDVACISSITEGEIHFGLAKRNTSVARLAGIDWMLARLQVLPWGSAEASTDGTLCAQQGLAGKPLHPLDMLIATHAVATGSILVTRDRAFH